MSLKDITKYNTKLVLVMSVFNIIYVLLLFVDVFENLQGYFALTIPEYILYVMPPQYLYFIPINIAICIILWAAAKRKIDSANNLFLGISIMNLIILAHVYIFPPNFSLPPDRMLPDWDFANTISYYERATQYYLLISMTLTSIVLFIISRTSIRGVMKKEEKKDIIPLAETIMGDHVFICYSRKDEDFVVKLAEGLKRQGVPVWLDQWDIPYGADWDQTIEKALKECTRLLLVISPSSVESKEVRSEWRSALDENKVVVPILYQQCEIPYRLKTIQYIDFTSRSPDDKEALEQILKALGKAGSTLTNLNSH